MQQHPTTGVIGGKPKTRLRTAKEQIPVLLERYLQLRNRQMSHKAMEAELNLAVRRGQLISKDLAVKQASFLMIVLRQRLLNLSSHTHKLVGLDAKAMRKALWEIAVSTLNEIKDLPQAVTNPHWLKALEKDGGKRGGNLGGPPNFEVFNA
jgi:hypothetical protein